jgi:hypothetical protein
MNSTSSSSSSGFGVKTSNTAFTSSSSSSSSAFSASVFQQQPQNIPVNVLATTHVIEYIIILTSICIINFFL